nr:hypothetical protein BaRGS_006767 [Batillaria attramentaria]
MSSASKEKKSKKVEARVEVSYHMFATRIWPEIKHKVEIYVDETQDFTQAELSLLVKLADNPNHMFLAGDTAQCIMQGVSFRFEDLKTLFYYAKRDSPKTQDKRSVITVPRVHQLKFNYRSHRGILNLASAIVDLLVDFFPESFDRLERDQGFLDGPKPVLLDISNCDMNDLTLLLTGDKQRTSHIEFGAHQAILVANDEAREKVPEELRQGIILTIYEAKGLEFDDVLLYNFFQDSQVTQYNLLAKAAKSLQTARVRLQAAQIFEKICKHRQILF